MSLHLYIFKNNNCVLNCVYIHFIVQRHIYQIDNIQCYYLLIYHLALFISKYMPLIFYSRLMKYNVHIFVVPINLSVLNDYACCVLNKKCSQVVWSLKCSSLFDCKTFIVQWLTSWLVKQNIQNGLKAFSFQDCPLYVYFKHGKESS